MVRIEVQGMIAILWINNPPVNALSAALGAAIIDNLNALAVNSGIEAVVIACEGRTFIVGADITEFAPDKRPAGGFPKTIETLAGFPKVTVAALHGNALGGGLEVALACDYRIAAPGTKLGLPEVKIGLLPGAGGTQRLPRLIGLFEATKFILSGNPVDTSQAFALGLVDEMSGPALVDHAVDFARKRIAEGKRDLAAVLIETTSETSDFLDTTQREIEGKKTILHAEQRILDCLSASISLPLSEGLNFERRMFEACMEHPQSVSLRHAFLAERNATKVPGLSQELKTRHIERIGIVGAGTMGGGITMSFADAGLPVVLLDASHQQLNRGLNVIRDNYARSVERGRLSRAEMIYRLSLIHATTSYEDLSEADLIIEAVFETLDTKRRVFDEIDRVAKRGAILATNTSALSIDDIAAVTSRDIDTIGLHFFSPANVMRLVEIIPGAKTSSEVIATACGLAKRIGKVGVLAGNAFGFIGNRMLADYLHQANLLLIEGAKPQQVDRALESFGMAMGPFRMCDMAGLDVGYKSRRNAPVGSIDPRSAFVADKLVEAERLGQKSSAGFYDYNGDGRRGSPSELVVDIIEEAARHFGTVSREIADDEIVERCMLAMFNTGCNILHEGLALRPADIDVVYLLGYGFPALRGGPMHWAEHTIGLALALEKIEGMAVLTGDQWIKPSPLLVDLAASKRPLASILHTLPFPVKQHTKRY